jgi:outer membrane receptor protein involved in Fe transport
MRFMKVAVWLFIAIAAMTGLASAQSTTGTISGRVIDSQDRTVPGVTVTVESPSLQGVRTAITSENGDYIVTLLPPGAYTVTFELSGFQRQQRSVTLAPTQVLPVDVTMGPAAVSETVEVVGRSADVLTQTAQVATNFSQDLIATLPTTRDINATLLLAPAVHPTGPSGAFSIAGSMSFENLFMINGVSVNENIRGQAFNLYIEDAIQETTIATAGVSAEYGRFGGGVVNMITKSGGNQFTGSFRDSLNNDNWRALVPKRTGDPFANDTKLDKIVPTYEYTFGGPIARDRLWFFTAGRLQTQESTRQLVQTNISYPFTQKSRRFEGNATYSLNSNHRFQGTVIKEKLNQLNNTFNQSLSMDTRSLEDRSTPQDIFTINYSGILTPSFFVEGRVSKRNFTFVGSGSKSTDIVDGTLLLDRQRGNLRYWAATFCGVCTPEERDNEDIYVKGSYFLSSSRYGSHNLVLGYDDYNDIRKANNRQSGSDYRILGTTSIINGTEIAPVFLGDGTTIIQWNPIPVLSQGSNFVTRSAFFNDSWRVSNGLTANLGIRFDKNDGRNQAGELVAKDSAFSPRLGIVWDPTGAGEWSVTASYAKYVAAVANSIADSSSKAGNPQTWQYIYRGPDVNGGGVATTPTADALRRVWAWFAAASGCTASPDQTCQPNLPTNGSPNIPGVATRIGDSLTTPNNTEYATGISRNFGARAALRVDYVFRDFNDFYVSRTDLSTGKVTNDIGQTFDLSYVENTNVYTRRYSGLTAQGTYRFNSRTDVGATYTLSHAWGNLDGENAGSGPITGGALDYPEYKRAAWNYPDGDVSIDQRQSAHLWLNVGVPKIDGLIISLLQALQSGVPYSASNGSGVDPRPFVPDLGYRTPPPGSATAYYFTVDCANVPARVADNCVGGTHARDSFRTEGQRRTDLAVNYRYNIHAGGRNLGLFVQAQVINLFNQFQLCGCGNSVFSNGGSVQSGFIDQTVRTAVTTAASYTTFNPFTTEPVQGVNWNYGPNFGTALSRFAYTTPRMFRLGFGVRF